MKKVVSLLLAIFLMCGLALAESPIDVSQLSPEEIEALQAQLDALEGNSAEEPQTSMEIVTAMIDAGAPINPENVTDYTEDTDPNEQIGTPGGYTSKTDYGCEGYAKGPEGNWVGGTLEVFDDEAYAEARYTYLSSIYTSLPAMLDCHMYLRGSAVLRISTALTDDEVTEILTAFESVVSGETEAFNGLEPEAAEASAPEATAEASASANVHSAAEYTQLARGDQGTAVAQMQTRLKQLGYLNDVADGVFGGNTEEAVMAFQQANGLEATGVATPEDQAVLFNGGAIGANGSVATAYDPYASSPAEVSRVSLESSYGTPYVSFTITNIGAENIEAVTFEVRFFDAFGDRLTGFGGETFEKNYSADLDPGDSLSINTRDDYEMYDYEDAASVAVAITRVLLADGTDLTYSDPVWFEGN